MYRGVDPDPMEGWILIRNLFLVRIQKSQMLLWIVLLIYYIQGCGSGSSGVVGPDPEFVLVRLQIAIKVKFYIRKS